MEPEALAAVIATAVQKATAPLMDQIDRLSSEIDQSTGTSAQERALRRHFPPLEESFK